MEVPSLQLLPVQLKYDRVRGTRIGKLFSEQTVRLGQEEPSRLFSHRVIRNQMNEIKYLPPVHTPRYSN